MRHHSGQNVVDSRGEAQYPQYPRPRKCLFLERDQVRDTKKEQELYITFSQSD